jgi:Fe-S-cluster containining protein
MAVADFTKRHVRRVGTRLSLLERKNGDCDFLLREKIGLTGCAIHPVRPVQCRTWPFWASNLESPETWDAVGEDCPGINQGTTHPLRTIQTALKKNGDLPL